MKVLVTGAGGFLGTQVVGRLLEHGYTDIRCMLRDPSKTETLKGLQTRYPHTTLEYVYGNLKSPIDAAHVIDGVNLVFHLAASMKGGAADMFLDTVVASRNLLDAIGQRDSIRIVLVSSFGVFGVANLKRGSLLNENTPLEPHPEWRDIYSHTKLRQEQLFWEYREKNHFELVVLRPGVIYGPGGSQLSARIGLNLFGIFLHLGGDNLLPLTYVENCAEAIVVAGTHPNTDGQVYNVHDDDIITSRAYLRAYKKQVKRMRSVPVPYFVLMRLSKMVERYHRSSKGQLPAIFTPYKTKTMWGGNRFDNSKLKGIGWTQIVTTNDGLARTFEAFHCAHIGRPT